MDLEEPFEENIEDNSDSDHSEYEEDEEADDLVQEGIDNSAILEKKKKEEAEKEEEDPEDNEEEQERIELEKIEKLNAKKAYRRENYKIYPLLTLPEYTALLGEIAYEISNSTLLVPPECEELFNTKNGNSIEIATNWMLHYKKYPIKGKYIKRTINGYYTQEVVPQSLIFPYELNNNKDYSVSQQSFNDNFKS
jgi:hypothetical protein